MNSLYNQGLRQTSSIQADLSRLRSGESSASLLGQIAASLAALHRTIDDFDSMAKKEMVQTRQVKAQSRLQTFRREYGELKSEFDSLRSQREADQRAELFSSATTPSATSARQRFTAGSSSADVSESPFRGSTPSGSGSPYSTLDREGYALNEHSSLQNTDARLDEFLAQGRAVLDNLVDQRTMLKGTQRRLLDAANTVGLSRNVINWIERRSTQDMYIFIGGAIFTFLCFFLIWRYLG